MSHTRHHLRAVAGLAVLITTLSACGTSGDDGPSGAVGGHNSSDVEFATQMIPHHAQALSMVDMTEGRDLSPEARSLVTAIGAAQAPEIEQMEEWLREWGESVPETSPMDSMDHEDMGPMSGMMSDSQMDSLEEASSSAFERMWMTMMIRHHRGAIEMAQAELEAGMHPGALGMARDIVVSQQGEIDQMRSLLTRG